MSKFSVQFLGTGSALPKVNAHPSAQLISCQNRYFLMDCGEGTQMQMRRFGVKMQRIDVVFISHLHGDHFFGLVGLLSSMHLLGRKTPITVFGPPVLEQIIRLQLNISGKDVEGKLSFDVDFRPIHDDFSGLLWEDKFIEVHTFPLKHKVPTHGFVFREKPKFRHIIGTKFRTDGLSIQHIPAFKQGKDSIAEDGSVLSYLDYTTPPDPSASYAYCSDTAFSETIIPFISGVDILYHEATFLQAQSKRAKATLHSTALEAATIAVRAGVKKLLIGHLSARFDDAEAHLNEARAVFPETYFAHEGESIRLS